MPSSFGGYGYGFGPPPYSLPRFSAYTFSPPPGFLASVGGYGYSVWPTDSHEADTDTADPWEEIYEEQRRMQSFAEENSDYTRTIRAFEVDSEARDQ